MELKTAIEILDYHQEWRLGKREDMIHEPKKLTEALDIVLSEVKKLPIHNVMPSASRPDHICDDEWWCPNCQQTLLGIEVTFDERHDKEGCYCPVI